MFACGLTAVSRSQQDGGFVERESGALRDAEKDRLLETIERVGTGLGLALRAGRASLAAQGVPRGGRVRAVVAERGFGAKEAVQPDRRARQPQTPGGR
jgi:hypothetical protein